MAAWPLSWTTLNWMDTSYSATVSWGTGEEYFIGSIQSLPFWLGRKFRNFDSEQTTTKSMRGLLWTTYSRKILFESSRLYWIPRREKGWGSLVWNTLVDQLHPLESRTIQLEVRASNHRAIAFYRKEVWKLSKNCTAIIVKEWGVMPVNFNTSIKQWYEHEDWSVQSPSFTPYSKYQRFCLSKFLIPKSLNQTNNSPISATSKQNENDADGKVVVLFLSKKKQQSSWFNRIQM